MLIKVCMDILKKMLDFSKKDEKQMKIIYDGMME